MLLNGDRDELRPYIRHLADLCGLKDWRLLLSDAPLVHDPDRNGYSTMATCAVNYGQKRAVIEISADWASWDAADLRSTVVHELLHCHAEPMRWAVNNTKHAVGTALYEVIYDAFTDAMELAVDGIATAWAATLPLPIKEVPRDAA